MACEPPAIVDDDPLGLPVNLLKGARRQLADGQSRVEDYRLSSPSLVLVDPRRTGPGSWKILQEVWQLNGDKPAFFAYVKDEVGKFLGTHGG